MEKHVSNNQIFVFSLLSLPALKLSDYLIF
nr:MAG TPA: hypothetical protein [Caudoviricetes sp.]